MTELSTVERMLRRDRALLVTAIGLLFLLSGLYTVFGVGMEMSSIEMTAMRGMRDMPAPRKAGDWSMSHAVLVFLMWWVMMVAMMLPGVAPSVLLHAALQRHAERRGALPAASTTFLGGYLAVWAGFSVLAVLAQWGGEATGLVSPTLMTLTDTVPGGLLLIAAGAFQITPLKASCLVHCRSPMHYLSKHQKPGIGGAFRMGLEHGVYCLGCCWGLMALLFVGGIMNLYWIVGLAAFVAIEKLLPFGRGFSKAAGAALILWGIYVVGMAM
ncbi:DUF2182 domain-containing protein [Salipiger mangrovisoli]|uniref:DUF2182 domain-containing protein n=1 Tax=Salipiger mangrovisoli TaxID=2865933 RepID=A0ABR9WYC7_9RHOB|nr:DUF2182 domain-containing protein [Salipiger mangrovisoli]MBE9636291.1 DUF2182 domain-containing protein [Salipiger mangrovisoli]